MSKTFDLIKEIIREVRLEADLDNKVLYLTHLELSHGESHNQKLGEIKQDLLKCRQKRHKMEKELVRKDEGA